MAASPQFVGTLQSPGAIITGATVNQNGTGGAGVTSIYTAPSTGTRIDSISVTVPVTSAAAVVNFFISPDGTTWRRLSPSVLVSAITPSATVRCFEANVVFPGGLSLASGFRIGAATTIAQETHVQLVLGGDL